MYILVDKCFWINVSNLGRAYNHLPTHLSSALKNNMFKTFIGCVWKSRPRPPYPPHVCMHAYRYALSLLHSEPDH